MELSSHTSVTSSCYLKTHAREGRSTQKGKAAGSRSVSLPRGVNQVGFLLEREDREKSRPLTLWLLLLTGSIPLCFSLLRPKGVCLHFGF